MADEPQQGAGEMMVFGLIEQADRIGKSAQVTQRELAAQIEKLAKVQAGIEVAIQGLVAERTALSNVRPVLANYAAKAMHEAIAAESEGIRSQAASSLREPLQNIKNAASHVQSNIREMRWLVIVAFVSLGMVLGLAVGYIPVRSDLNALSDHVDRIDSALTAQQPQPATAPTLQSGKRRGQR